MHWAVQDYNREQVDQILIEAFRLAEDEIDKEKVRRLQCYLNQKRDYMAQPGMGTGKSNHRVFTFRMKKQGQHWGKRGGQAIIKILWGLKNGDLAKAMMKQMTEVSAKISKAVQYTGCVVSKPAPFTAYVVSMQGVFPAVA